MVCMCFISDVNFVCKNYNFCVSHYSGCDFYIIYRGWCEWKMGCWRNDMVCVCLGYGGFIYMYMHSCSRRAIHTKIWLYFISKAWTPKRKIRHSVHVISNEIVYGVWNLYKYAGTGCRYGCCFWSIWNQYFLLAAK